MNYIKHLNHWMELIRVDDRLSPHHVSLYLALFQQWNKSHFADKITIFRNEVLHVSKIGSSRTYYKCLHELHQYGYIRYLPSYNPMKGSAIFMVDLSAYSIGDEANDSSFICGSDASSFEKDNGSATFTQVLPGQKVDSKRSKNDTGATQVVTPFKTNNKNDLNNTNRAQTARDLNSKNLFSGKTGSGAYLAGEKKKKKDMAPGDNRKPVSGSTAQKSLRSFSPPSLAEVRKYFGELQNSAPEHVKLDTKKLELEAVKFFHHFEANGWLVGGRSPMRNWQAACHAWITRIPEFERQDKLPSRLHHLQTACEAQYTTPL